MVKILPLTSSAQQLRGQKRNGTYQMSLETGKSLLNWAILIPCAAFGKNKVDVSKLHKHTSKLIK